MALDIDILEELGAHRYLTASYLHYRFAACSRSNLGKRLKKLCDDSWIGRKTILEPLTRKSESVYFLERKGVEQLMAASVQFASAAEIDMPRYHNTLQHDAAIPWLHAFLQRDWAKYLPQQIEALTFECRRSQLLSRFQGNGITPDALWTIKLRSASQARTYLLELDNATENLAVIRKKFLAYRQYLDRHHDIFLIVVIQHAEQRLAFLMRIARRIFTSQLGVFGCTLPEISTFGAFSAIWTTPTGMCRHLGKANHQSDFSNRDRFYLPL